MKNLHHVLEWSFTLVIRAFIPGKKILGEFQTESSSTPS
jgi:hypothetical protein